MKGAGRTEGWGCSKYEDCRKGCSNPVWAPKCMKISRDMSSGCGKSTGCWQGEGVPAAFHRDAAQGRAEWGMAARGVIEHQKGVIGPTKHVQRWRN